MKGVRFAGSHSGGWSRGIALLALVLVFCAGRSRADITLDNRISNANATASVDGGNTVSDGRDQVDNMDFLAANLSAPADISGTQTHGTGNAVSSSQIVLDVSAGTLQVSGSSSGNASATATQDPNFQRVATGVGDATIISLTFTLTDISYDYTVTGNLSAMSDPGQSAAAGAHLNRITGAGGDDFDEVVNNGNMPLSRSGALSPGQWRIIVGSGAQARADGATASGGGSANASFQFNLRPAGATPTPTPSGIHWINPNGGSWGDGAN
jgi:hypothetical protein